MSNYLLEIGLEEMPAHLVTASSEQLSQRMAVFLDDHRIKFDKIFSYSTPRRLALVVEGLSEYSEAVDEEVKGPSAKIAKDETGNWSKAIQGFARGQGQTPDDLELRGDYYYAKKHIDGQAVSQILTAVGEEIIKKMTFSTYMKWGNEEFLFVRPIQWLVSLLDTEVVKFDLLDVTAGRISRGHRFLTDNCWLELANAANYVETLASAFVAVDAHARQQVIRKQIEDIAQKNQWQVTSHEELLEEINNLVEWPTAFSGRFDSKYLAIPEEVLITSMRDNQRYFEVRSTGGKLAPAFIGVRDGNTEHLENVIVGNEKVLVARLEDAKFFWEEDQKLSIEDLVKRLDKVTFHAKIGSLSEHMSRTKKIAQKLASELGLSTNELENIERAASIYKFDLLTGMVGEFDELQGVMGEKYARLSGEKSEVAKAIREHYLPLSATGALPESTEGSVLALADKIDSLNSFFAAGLIPSGSNDPYALRRATLGILRIMGAKHWNFNLNAYLDGGAAREELIEFAKDRMRKLLEGDVRHDLIEAVLAREDLPVFAVVKNALALEDAKEHATFKETVENLSRVFKLADKQEIPVAIDADLFENDSEKALYRTLSAIELVDDSWSNLMEMTFLASFISRFFYETMVMDENLAIQNNRLALLKEIANRARQIADFSIIISK